MDYQGYLVGLNESEEESSRSGPRSFFTHDEDDRFFMRLNSLVASQDEDPSEELDPEISP